MIWIDCDPQAGREMKNVYPLAVLSPRGIQLTDRNLDRDRDRVDDDDATYNDTNPFAVKFNSVRGVASYILRHQPKSFDWRASNAKPHPLKKCQKMRTRECETLNQIIAIGS